MLASRPKGAGPTPGGGESGSRRRRRARAAPASAGRSPVRRAAGFDGSADRAFHPPSAERAGRGRASRERSLRDGGAERAVQARGRAGGGLGDDPDRGVAQPRPRPAAQSGAFLGILERAVVVGARRGPAHRRDLEPAGRWRPFLRRSPRPRADRGGRTGEPLDPRPARRRRLWRGAGDGEIDHGRRGNPPDGGARHDDDPRPLCDLAPGRLLRPDRGGARDRADRGQPPHSRPDQRQHRRPAGDGVHPRWRRDGGQDAGPAAVPARPDDRLPTAGARRSGLALCRRRAGGRRGRADRGGAARRALPEGGRPGRDLRPQRARNDPALAQMRRPTRPTCWAPPPTGCGSARAAMRATGRRGSGASISTRSARIRSRRGRWRAWAIRRAYRTRSSASPRRRSPRSRSSSACASRSARTTAWPATSTSSIWWGPCRGSG